MPLVFPFLDLTIAVVLDAFSRMPLAASMSLWEPSGRAALALLRRAVDRHGAPRHLVSDRGTQFSSAVFRAGARALGIRQRFGAVGKHGSIALIERFWRTLKSDLHTRQFRPWDLPGFERRLSAGLVRYAMHRPHAALGGRVPAEVYWNLPDPRPLLDATPRGRPGEPGPEPPCAIAFLDPEHGTLPILLPQVA